MKTTVIIQRNAAFRRRASALVSLDSGPASDRRILYGEGA